MADVSQVSMSQDTPAVVKKGKVRNKGLKAVKDAGKDVQSEAVAGDVSKENITDTAAAPGQVSERRRRKKRDAAANVAKATAVAVSGSDTAQLPAPAATTETSTTKAAQATSAHKGKGKASKKSAARDQDGLVTLPFLRLSEPLGNSARLPPVFSHDGRFCFVAAASSVKIYLVSSSQMLSTLDLPALPATNATGTLDALNNQVTSLFVNPVNSLQVITTSLDGFVRVWDYLEGKVLYSTDMGGPIACAAIVSSNSPAYQQTHLRETLFLAVNRGSPLTTMSASAKARAANPPTSIVSCVSLKRSEITKQIRLGKCKDAIGISVSSDGRSVVVLGRKKTHIAQIAESKKSVISVAPFISFEGLPSTTYYRDVTFTTVVCHPTESYFATGDTRGSIRLWYLLDEESLNTLRAASEKLKDAGKGKTNIVPSAAMSVLHWHAHAVSSLAFTPNGAYLLSGGEEAVLVVWQIESRHKEFVPRIGAPIQAINIINGQSGQQEFVVRLKDGTIAFLGAGTLKVVRTIAGVKTIEQFATKQGSDLPLAIEPLTNRLVFQASHPSTIQFYSASQDTHVYEQDVSPSNRVSRTDDRPIEPVRVEHIAFSASSPVSNVPTSSNAMQLTGGAAALEATGRVWMATFDTWQDRDYSRESHLKFWMGFPSHKPGYGLVSRIDNPHGQERVTSMTFSPLPSATASATMTPGTGVGKLCTTSLDGTVKLWSYRIPEEALLLRAQKKKKNSPPPLGIWQCLYSLSYRSLPAILSAFSKDGSLLAIVHKHTATKSEEVEKAVDREDFKVTLWNVENGNLVKAFNVPVEEVGSVGSITFAGLLGTRLLAGGEKGHVIWDLLTCEELATLPIPATQFLTSPDTSSDYYIAVSDRTATTLSLANPSLKKIEALPFPLSQTAAYPIPPVQVTFKSAPKPAPSSRRPAKASTITAPASSTAPSEPTISKKTINIPLIASIAKSGQVALLGPQSALRQVRPSAFETSANLQAALNSKIDGSANGEELRPVRLFDELFGPSSLSAPSTSTSSSYTMSGLAGAKALPSNATISSGGAKTDSFDEIPSHKLPSLSELWRGLLSDKLKPLDKPSTSSNVKTEERSVKNEETDDEDDDHDDEDSEDDEDVDMEQANREKLVSEAKPDVEGEDDEFFADEEEYTYENLPEEELIKIFRQCMPSVSAVNASPSKGSGIPSDRMAGKAGKDKSKKKRKSLLGSMV